MARFHDVGITVAVGTLLVLHVGVQSLRGTAAGWNQWRAASYAGAAWVGALSCASKQYGHNPSKLAFLGDPVAPGAGAPTSDVYSTQGSDGFYRMLLAATMIPVMLAAAVLNHVLFRHVSLSAEVSRPQPKKEVSGATGPGTNRKLNFKHTGRGKGSRYAAPSGSNSTASDDTYRGMEEEEYAEEEEVDDVESGRGQGWRRAVFGGFRRVAGSAQSVASQAAAFASSSSGSGTRSGPMKAAGSVGYCLPRHSLPFN